MDRPFRVPFILLGLGNVGRALMRQILDHRDRIHQRLGLRFVPIGLADSQASLTDGAGLTDQVVEEVLRVKADGRSLSEQPGAVRSAALLQTISEKPRGIVVDATTSDDTVLVLRDALEAGHGLVLANKRPLTGPWKEVQPFFESIRLLCEATVGAGLPVVNTLKTLMDTGDRVIAIQGCMSGTLGYLCAELERGSSYSAAVYQARELGYTESDPREDLGGRDVARKALILARLAGWPVEMDEVAVEPLFPESLAQIDPEAFMDALSSLDEPYAARVQAAGNRGRVLRYVADVTPDRARVGMSEVPRESVLGALRGPANHIAFFTGRYAREPLAVAGPGAGPEVTAAGVLGDMIHLAQLQAGVLP